MASDCQAIQAANGTGIIRIQDPAGKARTFTFDHGWLGVVGMDTEQRDQEG